MEFLMFLLGLLSGILGTFLWAFFVTTAKDGRKAEEANSKE